MPELRELLRGAGMESVRTYVASGNVIVESDEEPGELAQLTSRLIAERFGLSIDVVARTREEVEEVVRRNPLGAFATEPKRYQVSFLAAEPPQGLVDELAALATEAERFVAVGREFYAWHPEGVARSKLSARLAARNLGVLATARNWTTVTTLLEMARGA
jgi:uncharacterized protein (DUF1697 family)